VKTYDIECEQGEDFQYLQIDFRSFVQQTTSTRPNKEGTIMNLINLSTTEE
jgi:hypothetical protein